jgi:hypothetical protein
MRENASIVASLLTRSRDPSPLLRYPSVYSCCLATNEARRCATRHGSARLGSVRRKHRFVYCCVIVGAYFDVTVLAWHKYATIYILFLLLSSPLFPVLPNFQELFTNVRSCLRQSLPMTWSMDVLLYRFECWVGTYRSRFSLSYVDVLFMCWPVNMWCVECCQTAFCSHLLTLVPRSLIFLPWRWRG